jgi:hypothetical protein
MCGRRNTSFGCCEIGEAPFFPGKDEGRPCRFVKALLPVRRGQEGSRAGRANTRKRFRRSWRRREVCIGLFTRRSHCRFVISCNPRDGRPVSASLINAFIVSSTILVEEKMKRSREVLEHILRNRSGILLPVRSLNSTPGIKKLKA